jgi:amino acid/amide ABC transporter membrane protein 1, HAAT family (TC 3.A.1.4.-)
MDIFVQQLINGLVLGSVYALVALGYTMVYGILELINFAHGEVTMFGAMIALAVISALTGAGVDLPGIVVALLGLLAAIPACMALGLYHRTRSLPAFAPCAAAGAPDYRHRRVHRVAECRHADLGTPVHLLPAHPAARPP